MIKALIFDWGDTVMIDDPNKHEPMADWQEVQLVPGIIDALEYLNNHFILCIASNARESDASLMRRALERVNVLHFFNYSFTSKELGATKPNPLFFKSLINEMGLQFSDCIMIGNDYQKDIVGASQIGLKTIWFNPSNISIPSDLIADDEISSMNDLVKAVECMVN
ncbi:HAD family hydrolase [Paenibacillus sp. GCM10023252]|uniref:HAD family hydrolase n=1 Tax=Paenibacillus sp. GCM10023252 TaxID=3252649 RepID=UPI0036061966